MGSPFYVIGEKNGYYKVVAANQELLGQPKGLFAPLYSGRTHFKDAKKSPFVGWIDKNAVLEFNHSFVSKDNNFPLRYRVGATKLHACPTLRHSSQRTRSISITTPSSLRRLKESW